MMLLLDLWSWMVRRMYHQTKRYVHWWMRLNALIVVYCMCMKLNVYNFVLPNLVNLDYIHPLIPPTASSTPDKSNPVPPTITSNVPKRRKWKVNTAARHLHLHLQQRKSKLLACNPADPKIIDLETFQPDPEPTEKKNKWIQTTFYSLSGEDRALLPSPIGWLNDNLIFAAQTLLKNQSSIPGFQDTCLGMTMSFDIQRGEFIQILHDGHGHWLTISRIGASKAVTEIFVYDSMYPSVGTNTKKQIAALVSSQEKQIVIKMMNIQLQAGGSDCGLFAIAFATALANGIKPGECSFKQEIFCVCRMPEVPPMVECSKCGRWYHVQCVDVPKMALDDSNIEWTCPKC